MKFKLNWNWDLLDTLRTILLTVSIIANCALAKMFWEYRKEYHYRSDAARERGYRMLADDSLTHSMLRTIIKGQITTHDIQTYQLTAIDSLAKKKHK